LSRTSFGKVSIAGSIFSAAIRCTLSYLRRCGP